MDASKTQKGKRKKASLVHSFDCNGVIFLSSSRRHEKEDEEHAGGKMHGSRCRQGHLSWKCAGVTGSSQKTLGQIYVDRFCRSCYAVLHCCIHSKNEFIFCSLKVSRVKINPLIIISNDIAVLLQIFLKKLLDVRTYT